MATTSRYFAEELQQVVSKEAFNIATVNLVQHFAVIDIITMVADTRLSTGS